MATKAEHESNVADSQAGIEAPDREQLRVWFNTAKRWVELETGYRLGGVTLDFLPRADVNASLQHSLDELYSDQPNSACLLRKMQVERHGADMLASLVALYNPLADSVQMPVESVLPFTRDVAKGAVSLDDAYTALFVHELVHAADYARFPDNLTYSRDNLGNLAVKAVVEGHAQYLTRRICKKHNCSAGYTVLRNDIVQGKTQDKTRNRLSRARSAHNAFSYLQGERFIESFADDREAIEAVMKNPPQRSVIIRYPEMFKNGAHKRRLEKTRRVFLETTPPWRADNTLVLHNTQFLPLENYSSNRILAQDSYEVVSEVQHGEALVVVHVNIFWLPSLKGAKTLYKRFLTPQNDRPSIDGDYRIMLRQPRSVVTQITNELDNSLDTVEHSVLEFDYELTKAGRSKNLSSKFQRAVLALNKEFVVSVVRISPQEIDQDLSAYATELARAMAE